jgi:hypothetical protein
MPSSSGSCNSTHFTLLLLTDLVNEGNTILQDVGKYLPYDSPSRTKTLEFLSKTLPILSLFEVQWRRFL